MKPELYPRASRSVKLHQLQILKDTRMGKRISRRTGLFKLFGFEVYIGFIVEFLGSLDPI
jgi:radical SAM superfamily enzyme